MKKHMGGHGKGLDRYTGKTHTFHRGGYKTKKYKKKRSRKYSRKV